MAILTEEGNEYEVRIINTATKEAFREFVKLGDRENRGDPECERYIVAQPGTAFKIEITLKAGFCFKPYNDVIALIVFGGQGICCAGKCFVDENPECALTEQDYKAQIDCVNVVGYSKDIIGAPFVFRSLDVDEDLSNQSDVIGVNPEDIGHFRIVVLRRKANLKEIKQPIENLNTNAELWDATKVDQLNFKKRGITNAVQLGQERISTTILGQATHGFHISRLLSFKYIYRTPEFLDHLDIIPYPPPLYYNPWKSLRYTERQWALKELQDLSRLQLRSTSDNAASTNHELKEWRPWNSMQPAERQFAFGKLQKEQKAFERGEVKQQLSDIPENDVIVLDDDGKIQRPVNPRKSASIKREGQGSYIAIKEEFVNPNALTPQKSTPRPGQKRKIKEEPIDLDATESTVQESLAKRRKIKQEPIDIDAISDARIKQEPIDLDAADENTILTKKEATIKYDLAELEEAVILPDPPTPSVNREDSDYLEMAEEILRQTADEFWRIEKENRPA
ncbi:hypothetical protein NHQ30_000009 [Ciborinia camelliae]|nr:hypothetical protein NHQ30_000009 [Ciborinia camelliae]